MIGLGSIPGAERDIVRVRKWALLSAVGWPPRGLAGRVFVRGIVWYARHLMYTGGAGGFESRCPAFGPLAQMAERPVTSREVAGSSPARSTEHGSASCFRGVRPVWRLLRWRGVTLFGLRASRWA